MAITSLKIAEGCNVLQLLFTALLYTGYGPHVSSRAQGQRPNPDSSNVLFTKQISIVLAGSS